MLLALFLPKAVGNISVLNVFGTDRPNQIIADRHPGTIGIGQKDQALFLCEGAQRFQRFIIRKNSKAARFHDDTVHDLGKGNAILFPLYYNDAVNVNHKTSIALVKS